MIYSLSGKIIDRDLDVVAIDIGHIAYEVFTPRPEEFLPGEETTIYVYEVLTQDDHYLAGFKTKLEKEAFKSLIQVKGIGPKTALSALSGTTPEELFAAISSSDAKYLKKLPGIGPKAASQIILDLQGKLVQEEPKKPANEAYPNVRAGLKQLGFKVKEIDSALSGLAEGLNDQEALRQALRLLRKEH